MTVRTVQTGRASRTKVSSPLADGSGLFVLAVVVTVTKASDLMTWLS